MKKARIIVIAIFLLFIVAVAAISIAPNFINNGQMKFVLSEDGDYYVAVGFVNSGSNAKIKKLVVPDTYQGKPVKALDDLLLNRGVCTKLEDISFPAELEAICDAPLAETPLYQNEDNWTIETKDNVTYKALYIDGYLLKLIIECEVGAPATYSVKPGTLGIAPKALGAGCENLTAMNIPESVNFVAARGFYSADHEASIAKDLLLAETSVTTKSASLRINYNGTVEQFEEFVSFSGYTLEEYNKYYADSTAYKIFAHCNNGVAVYIR